jgi:hypothetical protein
MDKMKYHLLTVVLFLLLVTCSDGRPELSQAKIQFKQLYAGVQIISVRITEDEVVARSFEFRYRKPNDQTDKKIEIQFMKTEKTGR